MVKLDGFSIKYNPCLGCGSDLYDNCDTSDDCIDYDLKTGELLITPKSCDKCNFAWVLSESNELH